MHSTNKNHPTVVLIIALLLVVSEQICKTPPQDSDNCKECFSSDVLIGSRCYHKITGCYKYTAEQGCVQCQFGYLLNKAMCVKRVIGERLPEFVPILTLSINNFKNTTGTLSYEQILMKIGTANADAFSTVHEYLLSAHP